MAQQKRSNNRSGSSGSRSGQRSSQRRNQRSSQRSRTGGKRPQSKQTQAVTAIDYWHAFSKTRAFFPVMTVLIITVVVLLDLLISWNNFDRFFLILGIELVVVAVIWIIGLVMSIGNEAQNSDTDGE